MKRTILFALGFALVGLLALGTIALAQGPGPTATPDPHHPTTTPGASVTPPAQGGSMQPGMMNGNGMMSGDMMQMTQLMNSMGSMMGGGMMGPEEMNRLPNAKPLSADDAVARIEQYLAGLNNPDLKLAKVKEYTWNFYGLVRETSTARDAIQLIVDKYSGTVIPEMGPNMMWNTKYSPMAKMMGTMGAATSGAQMTLTPERAKENAQTFLNAFLPSTTLAAQPATFYGFYNFNVLREGRPDGMLSVNGNTGAVWYHTWHGDLIAEKEIK